MDSMIIRIKFCLAKWKGRFFFGLCVSCCVLFVLYAYALDHHEKVPSLAPYAFLSLGLIILFTILIIIAPPFLEKFEKEIKEDAHLSMQKKIYYLRQIMAEKRHWIEHHQNELELGCPWRSGPGAGRFRYNPKYIAEKITTLQSEAEGIEKWISEQC